MKSIHINMEKLKREFKSEFPVKSMAYREEEPLQVLQQIFNLLQIGIRLNSDIPAIYNIIDGVSYETHFPHVIIKKPGAECRTSPQVTSEVFYFTYSSDLYEHFKSCGMLEGDPAWELEISPSITHMIRQLTELLEHSSEYGISDRIDQLAFQLFLELLLARNSHRGNAKYKETKILQVTSYLQIHFNEDIDYERLSAKFGFSRRSLFRHWKMYYDKTPAEYIFDLKMKEAERLLIETGKSVGDITQELNYQGAAYFCAAFKKYSGLTPLQFREKFKNWKQY